MKIVFVSNYLSPHQIPFSDEMYDILGENYSFISCEPFSEERIKMGWLCENKREYEIRVYESNEEYAKAKATVENCNIMIVGSSKWEFVQIGKKNGKIIFKYSERLLKQGLFEALKSLDFFRYIKMNILSYTKNTYFLSASMYAPYDYKLTMAKFKNIYKWGYFPKTKTYNLDELLIQKESNSKIKILWAGRLIRLKHPEIALDLMERLVKVYTNIDLTIIGDGYLYKELSERVKEKKLENYVHMLGSMSPEMVRYHMERSSIFLCTSDYNEGWGAVVNEAMNSACAVVCSSCVGASGYLIQDEYNGYMYNPLELDKLDAILKQLITNQKKRKEIGKNAYFTIRDCWSEKEAANRFVRLSRNILYGTKFENYEFGPLSKAKLIKPKKIW